MDIDFMELTKEELKVLLQGLNTLPRDHAELGLIIELRQRLEGWIEDAEE